MSAYYYSQQCNNGNTANNYPYGYPFGYGFCKDYNKRCHQKALNLARSSKVDEQTAKDILFGLKLAEMEYIRNFLNNSGVEIHMLSTVDGAIRNLAPKLSPIAAQVKDSIAGNSHSCGSFYKNF